MKKKTKKKSDFKVTVTLSEDIYLSIKNMSNIECRTVPQQVKYLMLVGKEMVENASMGRGIVRSQMDMSDNSQENKELESAIGFRVD